VAPKEITVAVGARVTFVNNDNAFHEMSSDPHPIHTDCPEINSVGALGPGTSRQTAAFTRARTCGFHDHGQENNTSLQGRIVVR
jgi:plastocyanin